MKKVNFKQPKYILPLVIFLPLAFLGYTITNFFGEEDDSKKGVVTDNINMTLPDAKNGEMTDKMTEMTKRFSEDGAYTAIGALGNEKEELDSTQRRMPSVRPSRRNWRIWSVAWLSPVSISMRMPMRETLLGVAVAVVAVMAVVAAPGRMNWMTMPVTWSISSSAARNGRRCWSRLSAVAVLLGVWLQVMAQEVAVTVLAVALVTGKPLRSRSLNWCRRCLSRMPTSSIPSVSRLRSMSR